ncbi:hypothetical protein [Bdellovibrio svalbardensis]|uniref:hypothetical protein n=1 Tax=Bdellovibrio svalbardensis TaxID=2972972 RepID=UPI002407C719|nr:hypothetical protein [Bdellovibrio svalbardensis]
MRRSKKQQLVAAVLITTVPVEFQSKIFERKFMILSMPGDSSSLKWAKSVLEENESLLGKRCSGKLEYWQKDLIPWFESKGIGIRSVLLHGDIDKSLRLLRAHYGKTLRESFEKAGLHILPARSIKDIDSYIRLIKSEFTKNPQFGATVKNPKFLKFVKMDQRNNMKNGNPPLLVYRGKTLCGGLDLIEVPAGLDGKKRAAFGINLNSKMQGKGLSRALYERILLELQKRGFKTYYGNTGQPGVMRMGKIMGRWVGGYTLDRGVARPFPKDHFKLWL